MWPEFEAIVVPPSKSDDLERARAHGKSSGIVLYFPLSLFSVFCVGRDRYLFA